MTAAFFDDRLFADAVMARVSVEPLPTPARALRAALRTRDVQLASGAVWTAWHLTTSRSLVLQTGARLRNAALLAVLVLLLAISTVAAAAGATVVVRHFIDGPPVSDPVGLTPPDEGVDNGVHGLPLEVPPTDTPTDQPTNGDHPATSTPGANDPGGGGATPAPTPNATPTARPTDGHQGGGGDDSNGGDDNNGGDADSPEPTEAPEPTDKPEATEAPEATDAPEPTEAPEPTDAPDDGDSGSSGGSGDGGGD